MFKFIPYINLEFKLGINNITEAETLIEDFLKKNIPLSTILSTNPAQRYIGNINKKNQTFYFKRGYGNTNRPDVFVSFTGKYFIVNGFIYIQVTLRPSIALLIIPVITYLYNGYRAPFLFLIGLIWILLWHFVFFMLPFNTIGHNILTSFHNFIKASIVEEKDLSPKYLRF